MKGIFRAGIAAALLSLSCFGFAQTSAPATAAEPTDAQMQALQEQMDAMQAQMQQMRSAKTPAERQAAMQAHTQTMQAHMESMQNMGCCDGMTGGHMHGGMMDGDCMGRHSQE